MSFPHTFEVIVCSLLESLLNTCQQQSAQGKRRKMNRWQPLNVWIKDKYSAKWELLLFKMQSFLFIPL